MADKLKPPKAVRSVAKEDAENMIRLDEATKALLDDKVETFIQDVIRASAPSDGFQSKVAAVHNLGNDEIREASSVSNRMLERPMTTLDEMSADRKSKVSQTLLELRKIVEDLDPSKQKELFSSKRLFGFIPRGKRTREYFLKYQSSQAHINKIVEALYHGQDELRKDNAAIEQEKLHLWDTMNRLEQYIYLTKKLDGALEARVNELQEQDPEKARIVKEEMLFYLRQKLQDLQTQLAVGIQGYLALDMVRTNNLELIKGVDRASTTTVSALRTAVTVSQGLANQKLVLDQISALNRTTSNLIEGTSEMLKQQSNEVHTQASDNTVNVEQLQRAFNNVYASMDAVAKHRAAAVENMKQTVNTLAAEIDKAKSYLDRVRDKQVTEATKDLSLPELTGEPKH